jgi:hypothetical protein
MMLEEVIEHTPLHYLIDKEGQRTAVVIDIHIWNQILEALEDAEDAEEMRSARDEEDELVSWKQVVAEYQSGEVDRTEQSDAQV